MANKQLSHDEYIHEKRKFPIFLILDNIRDIVNIGSIFRLSDALGVSKIYICGNDIDFLESKKFQKVSRSTGKYVDFEVIASIEECISLLKKTNCKVLALEITSESISLNSYNFEEDKSYAFVVGNEKEGVSEIALSNVDDSIHIDMYGNNSSMNVSVATGIAVEHCLNKIR